MAANPLSNRTFAQYVAQGDTADPLAKSVMAKLDGLGKIIDTYADAAKSKPPAKAKPNADAQIAKIIASIEKLAKRMDAFEDQQEFDAGVDEILADAEAAVDADNHAEAMEIIPDPGEQPRRSRPLAAT